MGEAEWGPWVDGTVPPPIGSFIQAVVVDAVGRGDMIHECVVLGFEGDIVLILPQMPMARVWSLDRYRIRKPRALRDLITLAADPYARPPVIGPEGPVRQPERVAA